MATADLRVCCAAARGGCANREQMKQFLIEAMTEEDWDQVQKIYAEGIATGLSTFETEVPPRDRWFAAHRLPCNLVARAGEEILGWAGLSPISSRAVYAGVAELSIYVAA